MSARQSEIKKKLNLETFFALWISISLLGLTSVEAQTIISFIFFLEAKGSHDNLAKSSKKEYRSRASLKIKKFYSPRPKLNR